MYLNTWKTLSSCRRFWAYVCNSTTVPNLHWSQIPVVIWKQPETCLRMPECNNYICYTFLKKSVNEKKIKNYCSKGKLLHPLKIIQPPKIPNSKPRAVTKQWLLNKLNFVCFLLHTPEWWLTVTELDQWSPSPSFLHTELAKIGVWDCFKKPGSPWHKNGI